VRNRKGFHTEVAEWAAKHGYKEIRADGKIYPTSQPFRLERFREHDVEVVIGVLEANKARRDKSEKPPQALIDEALQVGHGALLALSNDRAVTVHSTARACGECGESFPPLDPKMFSYNSAQGWCPKCRGFGELFYLPDVDRGAKEDAVVQLAGRQTRAVSGLRRRAAQSHFAQCAARDERRAKSAADHRHVCALFHDGCD
jgi:excinuclease ABC subunit A